MRKQLPEADELATDVGPLLFPSADMVMRPLVARNRNWELDEATLFRAHLRRGMTVVDVGAHVGYYTILAARAVGRFGRVIAVEPDPTNAAFLRANLSRQRLHNVRVVEAAAWKTTTKLKLKPNREGNTGDHRLVQSPEGALEVDGIALDELLEADYVDAVKVDAQGADHAVLEGMERMLRRCLPVVFVELWPSGIRLLGDDPVSVIGYYRSLPFGLTVPGLQADFQSWPDEKFIDVAEVLPGGFATLVLRPRFDSPTVMRRTLSPASGSRRRRPNSYGPPGRLPRQDARAHLTIVRRYMASVGRHARYGLSSAQRILRRQSPLQRVSVVEEPKQQWFNEHVGAAKQVIEFLAGDDVELKGRRVVDIGCGDGIIDLALTVESRPRLLVGFDIEPVDASGLLALARGMGYAESLPPALEFRQSEPERIPAEDQSFDIAVTWSAFEHIANPRAVLGEVARILQPGGVLMLQLWPFYRSEHGSHLWPWFPNEPFVQFNRTDEEVEARLRSDPVGKYMLTQYRALNRITIDELQQCLIDTGFGVHKLEFITHQVRLPQGLARRHTLANLGIAGVKLLARSEC